MTDIRLYSDGTTNIGCSIESSNFSIKSNQKEFRHALIHCAAVLFVFICCICAIFVYHIFEPFLHSIIWALLLGTLLFPWKNYSTTWARSFLEQSRIKQHFLWYDICLVLPCHIIDQSFESVNSICRYHWKECLFIIFFRPTIESIDFEAIWQYLSTIDIHSIREFRIEWKMFDSIYCLPIIIIYLLGIFTYSKRSRLIQISLCFMTSSIWLILLLHISQHLSITYRFMIVSLFTLLLIIGFMSERRERKESEHQQSTRKCRHERKISLITYMTDLIQAIRINHNDYQYSVSPSYISIPYFTHLLCIFIAMKFDYFGIYLILILTSSFIYKWIKFILLVVYTYIGGKNFFKTRAIEFIATRQKALIPSAFFGLQQCLIKFDQACYQYLQASLDYLISAVILLTLCIVLFVGSLFLLLQIHQESVHLMTLTKQLINQTHLFEDVLSNRDYLHDWIETGMNQIYIHGRTWITKQVGRIQPPRVEPKCCLPISIHTDDRLTMQIPHFGPNSLSNKNLEEEILHIWDRLYDYIRNVSLIIASDDYQNRFVFNASSTRRFSMRKMMRTLQTIIDFYREDFFRLTHDNFDIFRTIFDSFWSNTTLIFTLCSTIFSVLLTGGFALWNICLSWFIFLTLLFYLLSNSHQSIFQPITWFNSFFIIGRQSLDETVNDVVTNVFVASLKMASFYGLYTYVVHCLFGCNLCFTPALIASICAVIFKSYVAVLPGCLDLWFVQQRPFSASLLLIVHILPVYIVDSAIYGQTIRSGHQYLIALAIMGGIYYRGLAGAFLGPIVLCCFLVAIRLYYETMVMATSSHEKPLSVFFTQIKPTFRRIFRLRTVSLSTDNENDFQFERGLFSP